MISRKTRVYIDIIIYNAAIHIAVYFIEYSAKFCQVRRTAELLGQGVNQVLVLIFIFIY